MLGPALVYTKDRLENLISASSSQQTISKLLDDDVATYWESDNKSDNEPSIVIDFEKDVIINYVDIWPVLLGRFPNWSLKKIEYSIWKLFEAN